MLAYLPRPARSSRVSGAFFIVITRLRYRCCTLFCALWFFITGEAALPWRLNKLSSVESIRDDDGKITGMFVNVHRFTGAVSK